MDVNNISGTYLNYMTSQDYSANKLSETVNSKDYTAASDDELLSACKKFEAYMLEQVFKEMQNTVDVFKDENSVSNYSNSMVDFFQDGTIAKLAETSTDIKGLGLAQSLYEQMKRNYNL